MAIKRFNDYEKTQSYKDREQLPRGGYVIVIQKAELKENTRGQYIEMLCDIAEGEHKNFYAQDYRSQSGEDKKWHCKYLLSIPSDDGSEQDGWTKRRFKTFTEALEDSNSGYRFDWDEQKFKGKLVGALFTGREYEYNNKVGTAIDIARILPAEDVRKGNFTLPADRLLKKSTRNNSVNASINADDFMSIPESASDDTLPF